MKTEIDEHQSLFVTKFFWYSYTNSIIILLWFYLTTWFDNKLLNSSSHIGVHRANVAGLKRILVYWCHGRVVILHYCYLYYISCFSFSCFSFSIFIFSFYCDDLAFLVLTFVQLREFCLSVTFRKVTEQETLRRSWQCFYISAVLDYHWGFSLVFSWVV